MAIASVLVGLSALFLLWSLSSPRESRRREIKFSLGQIFVCSALAVPFMMIMMKPNATWAAYLTSAVVVVVLGAAMTFWTTRLVKHLRKKEQA